MNKKIETMMKTQATYKRLGDYIRLVDVRNRDLKVEKLMGINIDKFFMPSVANVIGTDLSNYKVVTPGQFACNLMHVGRDEKIPMAMLSKHSSQIIVSPAYLVFEVNNEDNLMPQYLMMWFRRTEFDRNAWFYTDADVRGGLDKDSLLDMTLPIPPIEEQRKTVAEYQALVKRIEINNQLIAKLEDTAQAIYRNMFVDGIDKENLPEGWKMGTLGDVAESLYGYTEIATMKCIGPKFLRITDIVNNSINWSAVPYCKISNQDKIKYSVRKGDLLISRTGANIGWAKQIRDNSNDAVYASFLVRFRIKAEFIMYYLGLIIESMAFKRYISDNQTGSAQPQANAKIMESFPLMIPDEKTLSIFNKKYSPLFDATTLIQKENEIITELQSLLLAKMGQ